MGATAVKLFRFNAVRPLSILLLCALGWHCGGGAAPLPPPTQTSVSNIRIQANPNNVLSAVVSANVINAASVRVKYAADNGSDSGSTPDFAVTRQSNELPVLGLMPQTAYAMQVVATSADGTSVQSDPISFQTDPLPSDIPLFVALQSGDVQPGYTMLGLVSASQRNPALIVDQTGRVVWYRENPRSISDFQKQPDGTYTVAVNNSDLFLYAYFIAQYSQYDNLGNLLRTWSATGGWLTDNHELRLLPNGDALVYAFSERTMDLTSIGGRPNAIVVGNMLQRVRASGAVQFQWDAFDYLPVDGIASPVDVQGQYVDWTHMNAIDVTGDGNYLLSVRHLSQVVKIDSATGAVVWKLGGMGSDFQFVGDSFNGFSMQHGARELPNGNILMFDNGDEHAPPQSRAAEYQLDFTNRTATLVWQYVAPLSIQGMAMGYAQRLPNGNTLIAYGTAQPPRVQEVNPAGEVVWDLWSSAPAVGMYRAFRIASLY
jgi:hypothetical protein